jgi:hypothetical protein
VSSKPWRMTREQRAIARILRFEEHASWRKIGKQLGCDAETVQRAIDPQFERHKREVYQRRKEELARLRESRAKVRRASALEANPHRAPVEEQDYYLRRRVVKSDKAFCEAMRGAIGCGQEHASIGIDTRPSSPDARYHPRRGVSAFSATGSPAGMCSDN